MVRDLSGRSIFVASPSNLAADREIIQATVDQFNVGYALADDVYFETKRWEPVPGGVGHPQGLINSVLEPCDFLIVALSDYWGSPPSPNGPYSSGTEEEFLTALELLASTDAQMRDILLIFKTVDPDKLRDPGPQLTKVLEFRKQVESSQQLLYNVYDSDGTLRLVIERKLREWNRPLPQRAPHRIDLSPLTPVVPPDPALTTRELIVDAMAKADAGLTSQAELVFALASKNREPAALSEYAHFMRRTGRLESALELNQEVLSAPAVLVNDDPDAVEFRVRALSNIGVIRRKQGDLNASLASLREAVRTAETSKVPVIESLAYALDNLGLTLGQLGQLGRARECFERARDVRNDIGDAKLEAQSIINLARLSSREHDYDRAVGEFHEALALLDPDSDKLLTANALSGKGQALLARKDLPAAIQALLAALALNDEIQNSDGISIVNGLLGRAYIEQGDLDSARTHATSTKDESERSGNLTGVATGGYLLGRVAALAGDDQAGDRQIQSARQLAQLAGNESLRSSMKPTT